MVKDARGMNGGRMRLVRQARAAADAHARDCAKYLDGGRHRYHLADVYRSERRLDRAVRRLADAGLERTGVEITLAILRLRAGSIPPCPKVVHPDPAARERDRQISLCAS